MKKEYILNWKGGIDFDPVEKMLYLISSEDSGIHKMLTDGTGKTL